MEMTVKAVADNNPNVRRDTKVPPGNGQRTPGSLGKSSGSTPKPFRLLGITIQQRGTGGRHLKESGKTGLLGTLR